MKANIFRLLKVLGKGLGVTSLLLAIVLIAQGYTSFGKAPDVSRMTKLAKKSIYSDGSFENPEPLYNDWVLMVKKSFAKGKYPEPTDSITPMSGPSFAATSTTIG